MKRESRADDPPSTMMDHITELRNRFFIIAVIFIATSSLAYVFRDFIISLLLSPLEGQKLVYLNPAGGFNFIFLISMYVGFAFTAPLLIQQVYSFVKPILPKAAQKYSLIIFVGSFVLLVAGMVFGYLFAIPGALHFLYSFASEYIEASLTADSYLNFVIAYTIGLGLVFQLPLLLLLIHWIRPFTPGGLLKTERWVIVLAFVAAALITPTPDPLNQTVIALPIIIVYQIGVVAVLLSIRKSRRHAQQIVSPVIPPIATLVPTLYETATAAPAVTVAAQPKVRQSIDGLKIAPRPAPRIHPPARDMSPSVRPIPRMGSPRFYMDGVSPRHLIST